MAASGSRRALSSPLVSSSTPVHSFTPVEVDGSSPFVSKGQLTGIPRKVKDAVADVHNCVSKWNSKKQHGYDILNKIANIKTAAQIAAPDGHSGADLLPESLLPLCENIHVICLYLEKQVKKMAAVAQSLRALGELCRHQADAGIVSLQLPSSTPRRAASDASYTHAAPTVARSAAQHRRCAWTVERFTAACEHLTECYRNEARAKRCVAENLAHVGDRDTAMLMLCSWLHEPLVDDDCSTLLEAMLVETGHRSA